MTASAEQLEALKRELAAKDEAFFELSATLATVEAETTHRVQQVESQSSQEIRKLREQLLRAQQEANLARSQATQLQQKFKQQQSNNEKQQEQQKVVSPSNLLLEQQTNNGGASLRTTKTSALPPEQLAATTRMVVTQQQQQQQPNNTLSLSMGQRLAQHLLATVAPYNNTATTQSTLLFLSQVSLQPYTSELEIVCYMMEQCIQIPQNMQLQYLFEALSYSPTSCQWILQAHHADESTMNHTDQDDDAMDVDVPSLKKKKRRRRKSCMRIANHENTQKELERQQEQLENPLAHPANTLSAVFEENPILGQQQQQQRLSSAPTVMQQQVCRQLLENVCQSILHPSHDESSILSIRIAILLLLSQSHDVLLEPWRKTLVESCIPQLLVLWCDGATHLLLHCQKNALRRLVAEKRPSIADSSILQPLESKQLQDYMAASSHLLRLLFQTTPEALRQTTWFQEPYHARRLLVSVLDLLEVMILPNESMHTSPLTLECTSWLLCLTIQQDAGVLLLQTKMANSRSTEQYWHRSASAIGVAAKFLHALVLRQHEKDHLPSTRPANRLLNPVRNQLIRFFDRLLRHESNSFWTLVSEFRDLYTSAVSLLLTVSDWSSCEVEPEIRSMLRLQLDEIAMVEEEQGEQY